MEATALNRRLVMGKTVRLELDVRERDRYRRLLAYVYVGDLMVNAELVRLGYAHAMTVPPNVAHASRFVSLERQAREAGRGLWRAICSWRAAGRSTYGEYASRAAFARASQLTPGRQPALLTVRERPDDAAVPFERRHAAQSRYRGAAPALDYVPAALGSAASRASMTSASSPVSK